MCGIAGVVGRPDHSVALVAEMAAKLAHRGPDDEGYLVHAEDGSLRLLRGDDTVGALSDQLHWRECLGDRPCAVLAHRRLSIIDLSPAGHEPMISADGRFALVFNGEIYNYVELARELGSRGHSLAGLGDAAVLLAAFAEWGPDCVRRLRGMWAFAVYDRELRRLTISRDRFGIKPLYFCARAGVFAFASEMKALLPALPQGPRGSSAEAVRFLAWGGVDDGDRTLLEDVRSLPAGMNAHIDVDGGPLRLERYYDIAQAATTFEGTIDDAIGEYRERFADAMRLHMRSDVQVGSCLSGGIDSSALAVAATQLVPDRQLATFTAVYDVPAVDERALVELHAGRSGRFETHFVSPTAEGLLGSIDRFVWSQDQPVMSSSPVAQWDVMRLAGDHRIKVLLDGQGADEAIGGYAYFAGSFILELAAHGRLRAAVRAMRQLRERRGIDPWRQLGRAAYHQLPASLRSAARHATRPGYRLVTADHRHLGIEDEPVVRTFAGHCVDAMQRSLPELLRYEDRNSMAFSIESRVPFLDHPLVELVLSLPTEYKIHDGWTKYVQRKANEGVVPDEIVWRRDKLGFATPQQSWKAQLLPALRELVHSTPLPPFIDRARLDQLLASDSTGAVSGSEFWKAVFFLRWVDVYDVRFS